MHEDLEPRPSLQGFIQEALQRGGVPPSEWNATIVQVEEPIRRLLEGLPTDMYRRVRPNAPMLVGNTGVGKTFALAAFAKHALHQRFAAHFQGYLDPSRSPLYWCSVPDLVAEWKNMTLKVAEQERLVQKLMDAELLFLDDLGAETKERGGREFDKGLAFIERLIRHRYDHFRPTGCTTNCSVEALVMRYGAPLFSRLQHMCLWIEFPKGSRDRRLKPRPQVQ